MRSSVHLAEKNNIGGICEAIAELRRLQYENCEIGERGILEADIDYFKDIIGVLLKPKKRYDTKKN